jgi:hypothetical protein
MIWGLCIKVKVRMVSEYQFCKVCSHALETMHYVFRQYTAPIEADADEYNMEHDKRGKAIIFNHEKYEDYLRIPERTGTKIDKLCLKQRLEKLKFEVDIFDDLSRDDINKKLYESKYYVHCSKTY